MRGIKQKLINGKIPVYYPEDYIEKGVKSIVKETKELLSNITVFERIWYRISKLLDIKKLEALALYENEEDIETFLQTYNDADYSVEYLGYMIDFLHFLDEKPNIIEINDDSIKYLDRDGCVQLKRIYFLLIEEETIYPEHYVVELPKAGDKCLSLVHYKQIENPAGNDEGFFQTYSEQEKYIKKLEFMLKASGTPISDIEHAEKVIKEIEELENKENAIHLFQTKEVQLDDSKSNIKSERTDSILHNLEELIKNGCSIYFEEGRYSDGIFAGVDFPLFIGEHYSCYKRNSISDEIDAANSPGDLDAMNAVSKLTSFAEIHPEFLFATGKTLEDVLKLLDKRAELWNRLSYDEQIDLLDQFILFEDNVL